MDISVCWHDQLPVLPFSNKSKSILKLLHSFNPALITWSFETCGNLLVPLFVLSLHLLELSYGKDISLRFSSTPGYQRRVYNTQRLHFRWILCNVNRNLITYSWVFYYTLKRTNRLFSWCSKNMSLNELQFDSKVFTSYNNIVSICYWTMTRDT